MMYYKVVLIDKLGRRVSSFARAKYIQRVYREGVWTKPNPYMLSKGYGLFVYNDYYEAKHEYFSYSSAIEADKARHNETGVELWQCEVGKTWLADDLLQADRVSQPDCTHKGSTFYNTWVFGQPEFMSFKCSYLPLTAVRVTDCVKLVEKLDSFYKQVHTTSD